MSTAIPNAEPKKTEAKVTLDSPISRGEQTIASITVRRPGAGELRGLKLIEVINMDVSSLTVLLPRITTPALTQADVANLDPADLFQLGSEVTGFLLPSNQKVA